MAGDEPRPDAAGQVGTPADPTGLVDRLVSLLALEPIEEDLFRGARTDEGWRRVFGGQVVGQALMAACRTVAGRLPHSLHAYFMRPGDPSRPILYQVMRDRDGGSFSSRRVVAIQNGQKLLNLAASFQVAETGLSHQAPMPEVPDPESLEDEQTIALRQIDQVVPARRFIVDSRRPIEWRPVDQTPLFTGTARSPMQAYWFRVIAPLPADQTLHRVCLSYVSDMTLLSCSLRLHGLNWLHDPMQEASLDHAIWFHADVKMDEWMLYCQDSPWAGSGRGLSRGLIYNRAGQLIASTAQEGLIRTRDRATG